MGIMGCKCTFDNEEDRNDLEFEQQTIKHKKSVTRNASLDSFEFFNNEESNIKTNVKSTEPLASVRKNSTNARSKFSPINMKNSNTFDKKYTKVTTFDNLSSNKVIDEDDIQSVLYIEELPTKLSKQPSLLKVSSDIDYFTIKNISTISSFNTNLLKYINLARTKPYEFADHIIDSIKYIKVNEKTGKGNEFIFNKDDTCKVNLIKGKSAFIEAAEILAMQDCLTPLEFKEDLIIEIPNDKKLFIDKTYIEEYLNKKLDSLEYKLLGFHFDLGVSDPLTCVVLQIVDDNVLKCQTKKQYIKPKL